MTNNLTISVASKTKTVEPVVREFGVNITMGASNISFGLPDRNFVNSAYIAMVIDAGLAYPITNPLVPEVVIAVLGADLSMGQNEHGMNWIKAFHQRKKAAQVVLA
jgi:5-methyltetrahydrofolate--homocysteine methyltransferase